MTEKSFRIEHDLLGEREIPASCYYGVQTLRGVENFQISGIKLGKYRFMVQALAYIKKAAARANAKLGLLPEETAKAIVQACEDVIAGKYDDQFVVDMIQGGAGTSSNMNANEVIANVALEKLGYEKGRYDIIHPNNHVNMCQSTNDVYPTAIRLALIFKIRDLLESMQYLYDAIEDKSIEFRDVIKMGRTQLQDAVPMSLRQEFSAFAVMVAEDIERVKETKKLLREINLGATAIGTGLNAHPEYSALAILNLRKFTGIEVEASVNLVEATQDTGVYVQLSGVLKRVAVKLSKICNDLRLLSSGPRCGFNEIHLPAMAPGSTIMPGKVNPVIPEVVNQVAYHVIGNDITVTFAAEAGQLQLNAMEPIIAFSLFNSITFLNNACLTLADRCIKGITANREQCRLNIERSIGLVTALNPYIGYEKASEIAHEALESGKSVCELVLEKGYLSKGELDSILSPEHMLKPHYFQGG
jgi:aspartate ammonia-lyase